MLKTMGIPVWSARRNITGQKFVSNLSDQNNAESAENQQNYWKNLQLEISTCQQCDLHQSRTNTVFGVGNESADLMIIGEAPGVEEDANAEPFLGEAGQLLNQMLFAIGLKRQNSYIVNTLKCKTPQNRTPHVSEIEACSDYLLQQIRYIKPRLILSVGAVSTKNLLKSKKRIGDLRGQVLSHNETSTPIVATYHPAYLRRSPSAKSKSWDDLLMVKQILDAEK